MSTITAGAPASRGLNISLWTVQTILFLFYGLTGLAKLFLPVKTLADLWIWPGQYPEILLRGTGFIDLCGGLGILLPSLTRIKPGVAVLAAVGLIALQVCAITFHLSRGEAFVTPINFIALFLALFIVWGRGRKIPVQPR